MLALHFAPRPIRMGSSITPTATPTAPLSVMVTRRTTPVVRSAINTEYRRLGMRRSKTAWNPKGPRNWKPDAAAESAPKGGAAPHCITRFFGAQARSRESEQTTNLPGLHAGARLCSSDCVQGAASSARTTDPCPVGIAILDSAPGWPSYRTVESVAPLSASMNAPCIRAGRRTEISADGPGVWT